MKLNMKKVAAGLAIGAAALLATGCSYNVKDSASKSEVSCFGTNSCKGHGSCATHLNACKGQNACKGKGVESADSRAKCEKAGGTVYEG